MKDLLLDPITHDLVIKNRDLVHVSGIDKLRQKLKIKLLHVLGEWFLNIESGIPYQEVIWVKNPNQAVIESVIKSAILSTEGVLDITEFSTSMDIANRKLSVSFKVISDFGELEGSI